MGSPQRGQLQGVFVIDRVGGPRLAGLDVDQEQLPLGRLPGRAVVDSVEWQADQQIEGAGVAGANVGDTGLCGVDVPVEVDVEVGEESQVLLDERLGLRVGRQRSAGHVSLGAVVDPGAQVRGGLGGELVRPLDVSGQARGAPAARHPHRAVGAAGRAAVTGAAHRRDHAGEGVPRGLCRHLRGPGHERRLGDRLGQDVGDRDQLLTGAGPRVVAAAVGGVRVLGVRHRSQSRR